MNGKAAKVAVQKALLKTVDSFVSRTTAWEPRGDIPPDKAAYLVVTEAVFWAVDRVVVFSVALTNTVWQEPDHPALQEFLRTAGMKAEVAYPTICDNWVPAGQ